MGYSLDMKYGLKTDYNFEESNFIMPDMVLEDVCEELKKITKGFVIGNVREYDGPIESYNMLSAMATLSANLTATTRKDIQDKLGEIETENYKYELYLSAPKIENYKYRILFIGYSIGGYPVEVVVEQGIADELNNEENSGYIYTIDSQEDLERLLARIFTSKIIENVIQDLITASSRKLLLKTEVTE
jgi:hypothetical protein